MGAPLVEVPASDGQVRESRQVAPDCPPHLPLLAFAQRYRSVRNRSRCRI